MYLAMNNARLLNPQFSPPYLAILIIPALIPYYILTPILQKSNIIKRNH